MIYRTRKELIDAYFDNPSVSQSTLKLLTQNVDYYLANKEEAESTNYFDEPKTYFKIGSGVDCMITEGEEVFNQRYYISTLEKKPSDTIISIVRQVFDTVIETEQWDLILSAHRDVIIESCEGHEYQSRWGADAKFNAILREGSEYWNELFQSRGKEILTLDEHATIQRISNSILEDWNFEWIQSAATSEVIDIFFQLPLYFDDFHGIETKMLLDMVVVNRDTSIVKPYDFKTIGESVMEFPSAIRKRRYDIQGAFYSDGLQQLMNSGSLSPLLEATYNIESYRPIDNYSLDRFSFIVQSTKFVNNPVEFQMSSALLEMGRKGRKLLYTSAISGDSEDKNKITALKIEPIKGYRDLIEEYINIIDDGDTRHPSKMNVDWTGIIKQ